MNGTTACHSDVAIIVSGNVHLNPLYILPTIVITNLPLLVVIIDDCV